MWPLRHAAGLRRPAAWDRGPACRQPAGMARSLLMNAVGFWQHGNFMHAGMHAILLLHHTGTVKMLLRRWPRSCSTRVVLVECRNINVGAGVDLEVPQVPGASQLQLAMRLMCQPAAVTVSACERTCGRGCQHVRLM